MRPRIGITVDNQLHASGPPKYLSSKAYSRAVAEAGGLPLLLAQEPELAAEYIALCDALILTGGDDPRTEPFGEPTHPQAQPMDPGRQAFEFALLAALDQKPERPALGVCLGMQLMALHAGGRIHQHLPDVLDTAADHAQDRRHPVLFQVRDGVLPEDGGEVVSYHHQAVAQPGRLRTVATAPDGVIEAVDDPGRPFYVGVQWHPERGDAGRLNRGLIAALVQAARATR